MFAAASGARLAHRHNQATVKKQLGTNNVDGVQVSCKGFEQNQHAKQFDTLGTHGQRKPQKCYQNYTSKLYSSDSESVSKLSSSYVDLHGKIPMFGHVDFEDRERGSRGGRRTTLSARAAAAAQRSRQSTQREARQRWVRRNRIQDTAHGSTSEGQPRAAPSAAANGLLYIGLLTMCVGLIIAFVGTGDKGFKTIELKLIGPCLVIIGFAMTIVRILMCVCPLKCMRFNWRIRNRTVNTSNIEEECEVNPFVESADRARDESPLPEPRADEILPLTDRTSAIRKSDKKKRVLIADLPTASTVCERRGGVATTSFHSRSIKDIFTRRKKTPLSETEGADREMIEKPLDVCSIGSNVSIPSHIMRTEAREVRDFSILSDISLSPLSGFSDSDSFDSEMHSRTARNASKSKGPKSPNRTTAEILLSPSNLNE